jgi:pilus assembly protein CpaE
VAPEHRLRVAVVGEGAEVAALEAELTRLSRFELAGESGDAAPDVVLLVHGERADVREALATLREHSLVPVILATATASTELVHWALDAGIADVLPLPASPEGLHFAIEKAARAAAQRTEAGRGRVVTVFSPKGGSGKSVVSTNLAVASAVHTNSRTLLIDLDLQFGDAAIMLGLAPANTLHELIGTPATLDVEKLEVYTERHASGVDVLPAPLRPEDAELITEDAIRALLAVARAAYDVVVIDTAPFFYGPMLATLDETDQLFLLCNPDVPTLKNVRLTLQTLEMLAFPDDRLRVVLNRASTSAGIGTADVEAALGRGIDVVLPLDPAVPLAVNRAEPVVLQTPATPFGAAMIDVAKSLGGGAVEGQAASRASRMPKRFSFGRS